MSRNLDSSLAAALSNGVIQPVVLVQLNLKSGLQNVWSGVGDLVWNGKTFAGVGDLGSVGAITEASAVQAEGTTVTLSGIGLSQLDIPNFGVTPPDPPHAPAAGESVAWSLATIGGGGGLFANGPAFFNSGAATSSLHGGSIGLVGGAPTMENSIGLLWSGFHLPPEIPRGAEITHIYAVARVTSVEPGGFLTIFSAGNVSFGPSTVGVNVSDDLGTELGGQVIGAFAENTLDGGTAVVGVSMDFIGFAVYYKGTPLSKTPLLYEAMNDVRLGGAAKIWYGLWANGAFIGSPYLAFSGTVDKPTVNTSASTTSITLALENRLINLQRPNQRRYTAADQHLAFPDDLAFNWVELLNDMSLKEGTA